jgi:hypothetical protein
MGIYTDDAIIGLRILVEMPHGGGDYFVKYEFIDPNWRALALQVLPHFLGQKGVKIQTLHPFSTSHNINTGDIQEPGNIWLDNFYITLESLA